MEGLGLDNILEASEVEKLFSGGGITESEEAPKDGEAVQKSAETEETAEVDFSDLLGNQPESVGSGDDIEGKGTAPASTTGGGSPDSNLFFSIAKALRDEGVFPDLSDDALKEIKDAGGFRKLFDDEVSRSLSERQQRLEAALNIGAPPEEVKAYQSDLELYNYLGSSDTEDLVSSESDDGERLRKQLIYQDYINRGINPKKAEKLVNQSFADGNDIDDAKEALESCKKFYKDRIDIYAKNVESQRKAMKEADEEATTSLRKQMMDTDTFFGGVKVDKNIRQKAYDMLTKPVYKDDNGHLLTGLQKYQKDNPQEFLKNMALMCALTDNFSNVEKLTKSKVKAGLKKGFEELESIISSTRRNSDGTLNLANGEPDMKERERWELAI